LAVASLFDYVGGLAAKQQANHALIHRKTEYRPSQLCGKPIWLDYSIRQANGWANGQPIPKPVAIILTAAAEDAKLARKLLKMEV